MEAPICKEKSFEINYHGNIYKDNYAWLKNKSDKDVIDYLNLENQYTDYVLRDYKEVQEKLFKEMVSRIKEDDESVPYKLGNYYYYYRTEKNKQYKIYCRKKDNLNSNEEIILDLNEIAKDKEYLNLGVFKISPNNKYLAYSIDCNGSEFYTLYIKDLDTMKLLETTINNTSTSLEWFNDSKTFLYTILDEANRPYKVYKHKLFEKEDELIYHEKDDAFYINLSKSNNKKYIFITMVSQTTSEVYYLSAENTNDKIKLFEKRLKNTEYYIEQYKDYFFVITNRDNALNFKIMKTKLNNTSYENWEEYLPHRDNVRIDNLHLFENYIVIVERSNGLKNIRIKNENEDYYINFDEDVYNIYLGINSEFNTEILRFHYSSLTTPETIYFYDMKRKTKELKKRQEVLGGYNPEDYQTERIWAKSYDGVLVPISLVYKKGLKKDGNNLLYLYGYGSYEISIETNFSSHRLSLIDRGFIYAIAHIRGGGELGRKWYEDGKFLNKKNTFKDFIACAEHLINEKYTSKDKLVICGGSAGGLLMGAVTNMRPDLFKCVIAHVPFVDVVNTMMDEKLPLTVIEYDEWGNPNDKKYFDYMLSYSPYDNIEEKEYPNMLVLAGLNDPRVGYWEPAKYVAKLRKLKKDKNTLLLKTNMEAGHGGVSGRYDYIRDEIAFEYSFIFFVMGIKV
ncbi:MAG: oligopeptidase B [Candidatus Sericytochromatia bacterium]|nr:MAG: oligopeptidase B [Candidatus Sericytochromatia bacterium]